MRRAYLVFALICACAPAARPRVAPVAPSAVEAQLAQTGQELKSARYALEPPNDAAQSRDAARVPPMRADAVTPEWLMVQIATMQSIADDDRNAGPERARANVLAATAEGLVIEHFSVFWDKAESGRHVIAYLKAALREDPANEDAAVAYAFTMLGIRDSGFRSQAEATMGVNTTTELTQTAPLLDAHRDSLLAQSVLACALHALAADAVTTQLGADLAGRIDALRARDADTTALVDDQLRRCPK